MRKHVVCPHRHPNIACRGHDQAVESTCPVPCGRGVIAGEGSDARIKTEQEFILERGEPDGPLGVHSHTIGEKHLYTPSDCERIVAYEPGAWIKPSQGGGVEFGEPDIPLGIERQLIGGTWQRERFARVTGVGDGEPGQGVDLKVSGRREVVPDVVGVLFGKPDGIVGCDLHPHHPEAAMRWGHLLEGVCPWVKDGQGVPSHLTKPDPTSMVNNETHYLAVRLGKGVFMKLACCCRARRSSERVRSGLSRRSSQLLEARLPL